MMKKAVTKTSNNILCSNCNGILQTCASCGIWIMFGDTLFCGDSGHYCRSCKE